MALTWVELEDLMQPDGGLDLTLADLIPARPLWMAAGVCRDHPEVTWFPAKGQPTAPAKALCGVCPVLGACEAYALADDESLTGVWAGTTARERLAERRRRTSTLCSRAPVNGERTVLALATIGLIIATLAG